MKWILKINEKHSNTIQQIFKMACSCNSNMDIRGRCCPFINNKEFLKCKAQLHTALFHFENDSEIYRELEREDYNNYEKVIKKFLKKIKITAWSDINTFTEMFIQSKEDEEEGMDKYFKSKYFNKFQFRAGRIVQGYFMNDYDLSSFCIVKSTKTYIEAYPIYTHTCGDVRKFTKPNIFSSFKSKV